ncbi:MAG: hypothetical protein ACOH1R_11370 [Luteimonas sp.]
MSWWSAVRVNWDDVAGKVNTQRVLCERAVNQHNHIKTICECLPINLIDHRAIHCSRRRAGNPAKVCTGVSCLNLIAFSDGQVT